LKELIDGKEEKKYLIEAARSDKKSLDANSKGLCTQS